MKGPGNGKSRENPLINVIVRHDSQMRKSGVTRPGIEPGSPWWEASRLTAQPPWCHPTSVQSMSRQSQCSRVLQAPSRTVGFTRRFHAFSSIQATKTSLAVVPQSPVVVHSSLRSRTLARRPPSRTAGRWVAQVSPLSVFTGFPEEKQPATSASFQEEGRARRVSDYDAGQLSRRQRQHRFVVDGNKARQFSGLRLEATTRSEAHVWVDLTASMLLDLGCQAGSPASRKSLTARSSQSNERLDPRVSRSQSANGRAYMKGTTSPFCFRALICCAAMPSALPDARYFVEVDIASLASCNTPRVVRRKEKEGTFRHLTRPLSEMDEGRNGLEKLSDDWFPTFPRLNPRGGWPNECSLLAISVYKGYVIVVSRYIRATCLLSHPSVRNVPPITARRPPFEEELHRLAPPALSHRVHHTSCTRPPSPISLIPIGSPLGCGGVVVRILASHRVRFPARTPLDFRLWESYRTMQLVGGFSRGSPVSPPLPSGAVPFSLHSNLIGSQDLVVKGIPQNGRTRKKSSPVSHQCSPRFQYVEVRSRIGQGSIADHHLEGWDWMGVALQSVGENTPSTLAILSVLSWDFSVTHLCFHRARWRSGNSLDSHSGGPGFEPSGFRFPMVFRNQSRLGWLPNKRNGRFLPQSLFPVQLAPSLMISLSTRRTRKRHSVTYNRQVVERSWHATQESRSVFNMVASLPTCTKPHSLRADMGGLWPSSPHGASMVERLVCSPPTKANRVQSPAGSLLQDFRLRKSCQTMPLVSGFPRVSIVYPLPFIPAVLHTHLTSPSLALKSSFLGARRLCFVELRRSACCSRATSAALMFGRRGLVFLYTLPVFLDTPRWLGVIAICSRTLCGNDSGPACRIWSPWSIHGCTVVTGSCYVHRECTAVSKHQLTLQQFTTRHWSFRLLLACEWSEYIQFPLAARWLLAPAACTENVQ
ncbi:hypothetical protein PR048_014168 [Dryococelus australis]|uniref:Uncharacterized protein n=1 Tax=Dryococelus australis TaxID=614101 RepID=A0ABQ9HDN3_9NEOP|nr:hypothetical protein PR048_014168 [Dryococelus australis]